MDLLKSYIDIEESDYETLEKIILLDLNNTTDMKDLRIPILKEYIKVCKKYNKAAVITNIGGRNKNGIFRKTI